MMKKTFLLLAMVTLTAIGLSAQPLDLDKYPWLDTSKSFHERAVLLVKELTLREKVDQLGNNVAEDIKRNGIVILPHYQYWNEAIHGVARSGAATSFPESKGMSATWDRQLIYDCAWVTSDEARIYHLNTGKGLNYWSPTINMAREPRWGREEENYGEDPYLAGELAVPFIRGFQGAKFDGTYDNKYLKIVATAKHYAANNYEAGRHSTCSFVTERNMREYYLPAFEACVREAGVKSIMSAYNAFATDNSEINAAGVGYSQAKGGLPCSGNKMLLTDILRKEWGFDGYVTSDCAAVSDIYRATKHLYFGNYTAGTINSATDFATMHNPYQSATADDILMEARATSMAIKAGLNTNCEFMNASAVLQRAGVMACDPAFQATDILGYTNLTEADIDAVLIPLLETRFALGEFEEGECSWNNVGNTLESEANQAVALRAAQESITLMKNEAPAGGTAPLLPLSTDKKVAVIGPYANAIMLGDYSGTPTYTTTPYQAFCKKLDTTSPSLKPNDGIVQFEEYSAIITCKRGESSLIQGSYIGNTAPGDKLRYDNVNFGKNGATLFAMSCSSKDTGLATVKIYLDDATTPFITLDNKDTGGWTNWTTITTLLDGTITGKHTVYIEFTGTKSYCGNYDFFRFYRPSDDGTAQFEEYSQIIHSSSSASKLNQGNGCLENTKPGDIFLYENVNFGTDANTLSASVGATNKGVATLSFYLDNNDTTPVAVINTEDTGGWANYKTFTAALSSTISGIHSVTVKITGEQQYGGNLDWFRFYNPNVTPSEEEPEEIEVPTGQKLYMYTTSGSVNIKASDEAIALAKRIAEQADVVIFIGGTNYEKPADHATGTEGHDRWVLTLPGNQEEVLKTLYEVNKNIVLVLESGSSLDIAWEKANLPAIIEAWYGGQAQGQAICDAIYGDINPSGKLTSTWYNSISELPSENDSQLKRNGMLEYNIDEWGYTYMYYGKSKHQQQAATPMFPFGFGLSYTTFEYSDLQAPASIAKDDVINVTATIKNTGSRDGAEVVQLYANYNGTGQQAALNRKLIGFERVELKAGESKQITIAVPYRQFSYFDEQTHQYKVEGRTTTLELAASSADIRLTKNIQTAAGVAQETYISEHTTSIPTVKNANQLAPNDHIYSVIGAYVCPAADYNRLPKGIYVLNGHKYIKK